MMKKQERRCWRGRRGVERPLPGMTTASLRGRVVPRNKPLVTVASHFGHRAGWLEGDKNLPARGDRPRSVRDGCAVRWEVPARAPEARRPDRAARVDWANTQA